MSEIEHYLTITARRRGFAFTKTLPFSKEGVERLRELVEFLENQLSEEEKPHE